MVRSSDTGIEDWSLLGVSGFGAMAERIEVYRSFFSVIRFSFGWHSFEFQLVSNCLEHYSRSHKYVLYILIII